MNPSAIRQARLTAGSAEAPSLTASPIDRLIGLFSGPPMLAVGLTLFQVGEFAFVLARVFAQGTVMREELEGTV